MLTGIEFRSVLLLVAHRNSIALVTRLIDSRALPDHRSLAYEIDEAESGVVPASCRS